MLLWIRYLIILRETDNKDQMRNACNDRVDLIAKLGQLLNKSFYLE